jgi:hypothetical protein
MGHGLSVSVDCLSVRAPVAAVVPQIPRVLTPVAAVTLPVAQILAQVALVLTTVADVLAPLLSRVVVPDIPRVLPQLTTILSNFMVVAAKLAGVAMDLTPVRAKLARFARRHSRVTRNVWMFDRLCVHEGRTSNEQGRSNGRNSEIAHRIPQRQYRALAVVACAARTTVALWWTLRAKLSFSIRQLSPYADCSAHRSGLRCGATSFMKSDLADKAETAGSGFASTLALATSGCHSERGEESQSSR